MSDKNRILKINICSRCKRQRPIYQKKKQLCGSCRQLAQLYSNPERYKKYLAHQRENYKKNRAVKIAYNYKYYRTGNHAEKMKAYGLAYWRAHEEKYREYKKKWAKEHPEKVKENYKRNYKKNREKILARGRKWRAKNKEKVKAYQKNYMNSPLGKIWMKQYYQKNKEKFKLKRDTPKHREYARNYMKRADVRARLKLRRDRPEVKKAKHDYDMKRDERIKKEKIKIIEETKEKITMEIPEECWNNKINNKNDDKNEMLEMIKKLEAQRRAR